MSSTPRPVFVFSTPPTPNGDLHLGHVSGPYLGADAHVRYLRMTGVAAWHLTGSDDYQSYVVERARRDGGTPAETAARFSAEIAETLRLMGIEPDQYTVTSTDPDYADGLRAFFGRLVASGAVARREGDALFDAETGAYLYEVDVSGGCPTCGEPTGGNICEECGEPNSCADLVAPRSGRSGEPPKPGTATRYSLPLHEFGAVVEEHLAHAPQRLRDLAARLFARERLDIAVSHPADWGVRPEGSADQVIWVWPEMAWGFLRGIELLGERLGRRWRADEPGADWKIVHFFGYDNSFYHSVLYPVLYRLAYPGWECDIDYHVNEFYLLDDAKFSTSRKHAVWAKEFVGEHGADAVRFFLARTRPEGRRTSFRRADFDAVVSDVLVGGWQAWLTDLAARSRDGVPPAGEHPEFTAALMARLAAITAAMDEMSLNRAAEELDGIVQDAVAFRDRTSGAAVAHELAAAKLLARCAAPVMPRFAAALSAALGEPEPTTWPTSIEPATAPLAGAVFFGGAPSEPALLPWLRELLISTVQLPDDTPVDGSTLVELGVGSLHAVALQFQILQQLDVDVSVEDLLGERDVAQLAELIEAQADPDAVADLTEDVLAC